MCPNMVQNIMVISTPSQENADRYVTGDIITISNQENEVRAYVAAPNATCKGVIRGISLNDGPEIIERKIVNERNPLALDAKRIKNGPADRALRRLPNAQLRIVRRHHHQVHPLQKENRRVPHVWKHRASLGRVSNAGCIDMQGLQGPTATRGRRQPHLHAKMRPMRWKAPHRSQGM
ncbi:hypothetical protein MTO96_028224 [Rhipicephalus appendiculatus]